MEQTCNKCNHWDDTSSAAQQENFGECNVLSAPNGGTMQFVLPVVQSGQKAGINLNATEMITSGDFGCNQFAA